MELSIDTLTWAAGAALSLACSYIPGLRQRYAALDGTHKRLVMLVLLAVVTLALFGIRCAGLGWGAEPSPQPACSQSGAFEFLRLFAMALWANQGTYLLSPRPASRALAGEDVRVS